MDYKYIEQLLERYWQAETTLEEEEILRTFFCQKDLPAEMQQYAPLFAYERRRRATTVSATTSTSACSRWLASRYR